MKCLFCQVRDNEIPADRLYEDNDIIAFTDINPQAPHHVLIIPTQHIQTLDDVAETDTLLLGRMVQTAKNLAKQLQVDKEGYRLVFNCKQQGGQEVDHIHLHLLAGRQMHWPPG